MLDPGFRGSRSTQTPAGSAIRRNGSISIAPSAATSNGVASSATIATSGIATIEICDPNWEIVCAPQSRRKSAWRQSPPVGQACI